MKFGASRDGIGEEGQNIIFTMENYIVSDGYPHTGICGGKLL